jgi:hypothetical protein
VAVGRGWIGGAGAIQRAMRELFGDVEEPGAPQIDDAPVTEPHSIVPTYASSPASLPRIAEPTRLAHRLARGTEADLWCDELDERTRGRGPVRRSLTAVTRSVTA